MIFRASLLTAAAIAAIAGLPANAQGTSDPKAAPSGIYALDPAHASVTFKINHLGFSHYTGRFDKLAATLDYNAADPAKSKLDATIETESVDTGNTKLEDELRDDNWFNVEKYPQATFKTTKIEVTGPTTGKVTGYFTLMGHTHELVLDTTLIGAGTHPMMQKPIIGFSATGTIHRSDYGMTNYIPMVGDEVTLEIEAEFDRTDGQEPAAPVAAASEAAASVTPVAPTITTPTVAETVAPAAVVAPAAPAVVAPLAPAPVAAPVTATPAAAAPAVTTPAVASPATPAPAQTSAPATPSSTYYPVPVKK